MPYNKVYTIAEYLCLTYLKARGDRPFSDPISDSAVRAAETVYSLILLEVGSIEVASKIYSLTSCYSFYVPLS